MIGPFFVFLLAEAGKVMSQDAFRPALWIDSLWVGWLGLGAFLMLRFGFVEQNKYLLFKT